MYFCSRIQTKKQERSNPYDLRNTNQGKGKLHTIKFFTTMARIVSIFQFTGRAGSAVGSKGKNGKILLRQYQPSVANPRTDAQMKQRARIKLAAQVAGMLGEVGRTALIANGHRKSEYGLLIKQLLKSVVVNQNGSQASLQYDLNLVESPTYANSLSLAVTSDDNAFVASFSGAGEGNAIAKALLVHDLNTGSWRHTSALDTNTAISLGKSASEEGNALEVFAYGIVLMPKTDDAINSLSQTGANTAGFVLDLNKVSSTNFNFSPSVSAALSVAANGTTSGGNGATSGGSIGNGSGDNNGSDENQNSQNNQNTQTDTVAAPTISGNTSFTDTTEVSITGPAEAEIRYTTDGSTPTAESSLYSEALTLSETTTVKAIAIKNDVSSTVASKTFTKGSGGSGLGDTN